uniref:Thyrostimulin beta n=1 Tax=Conus ermineus TaxID=55423 RepID=A0A346CIQ3_CONER|nr:thyrostimulin beta [Conus ermineus]
MMITLLKLATRLMRRLSHVLVFLAVLCLALTRASTSEVNPGTTLQCHVREYSYRTSKPPLLNQRGDLVTCEGIVRVNTCWGRCDSYEVGDFQMPFKVSHHPVCTYAGYRRRTVTLGNCRGYPDPTIEVLDATACACRPCDSADTSCENLDG